MRYKTNHKDVQREAIIPAAERLLKERGYFGAGMDALAAEAGVTSGALYSNFGSKETLFQAVLAHGVDTTTQTARDFEAQGGDAWLDAFLDYYISPDHALSRDEGCVLPPLGADVARLSEDTRQVYEQQVDRLRAAIEAGVFGSEADARRRRAWTVLTLMVGAISLARSFKDDSARAEVLDAARTAAKAVIRSGEF